MMKWLVSGTLLVMLLAVPAYSDTRYNFPQLALGGGYEAVIMITNTADHPWNGSFRPYQGFNVPWQGIWAVNGLDLTGQGSFAISIPAKNSVKFRLTGDPAATRAGYLDIDQGSGDSGDISDIVAAYFYEFRNSDGSLGDTIGGPITPSYVAAGSSWGFTVEKAKTVSTGLAWCPTTRSSNVVPAFNVSMTLYDEFGAIKDQKEGPAFGYQAQFFDQIFAGLPENFLGYLKIQSDIDIYMVVLRLEQTPTGFQITSTPAWQRAPAAPDDLSGTLEQLRRNNNLPGLTAAVFYGDTLRAIGAAGVRKLGDPTPATSSDEWHIGNSPKTMTATLAMLLFREGILSLSTTLAEAFPEWASTMHADYRNVTLEMLMRHRGGAPSNIPPGVWTTMLTSTGTSKDVRREAVQAILTLRPQVTPGLQFLYSNAGYMIIGAALEEATGIGWEEMMATRLFNPLGMNSCGFGAPSSPGLVDQPWGHISRNNEVQAVQTDNPLSMGPAITVHCSVVDWGKFIAMHLQGTRAEPTLLLSVEDFATLQTPLPGQDYALGWSLLNRWWAGGDGTVFSYAGSNGNFLAWVAYAPAKNAAVLIMTNMGGVPQAVDSVFGELIGRYLL